MNVTLYPAERGGGKTSWLLEQTELDVSEEKHVAIIVPVVGHARFADYEVTEWCDVWNEERFEFARGKTYAHIYIDDADLFDGDPVELCRRVAPMVPVSMTYTPVNPKNRL